ncbi:hypothetical protein C1646_686972, partial [Rhizophagus diaphanus]
HYFDINFSSYNKSPKIALWFIKASFSCVSIFILWLFFDVSMRFRNENSYLIIKILCLVIYVIGI